VVVGEGVGNAPVTRAVTQQQEMATAVGDVARGVGGGGDL